MYHLVLRTGAGQLLSSGTVYII